MREVKFGVMLRQEKIDFSSIRDGAILCDELGYDSVWFYDHLIGVSSPELDIFESWTLMSALSAITSKVRIGTLVLCNSFRHPALLAKMASTLDNMSDGRLDFAVGAGWYEEEYKSYGYEFPSTATRIEQLREAVRIIKALWTEERATFKGKHYQINNALCNPKPVQKPHPPVIIGGSGEKLLLRVVAEVADGWNCPATSADAYDRKLEVLKKHCRDIGRDINEIKISEQTIAVVAEDRKELSEKLPKAIRRFGFFGNIEKTGIVGMPDECINRIREKVDRGVTQFMIFFSDGMNPKTLRLFAQEVIPAFS